MKILVVFIVVAQGAFFITSLIDGGFDNARFDALVGWSMVLILLHGG